MDAPADGVTEPLADADAVCFDNVSLTYDGAAEAALENVSFTARRGDVIGVIGGTGSGKSTLVNLIPRFYDATEGEVRIGGVSVKDWSPSALRDRIAIVPQKAVLFHGTIRENLLWGKSDATDEEMMTALRAAQAEDVVLSKEGQLDAPVEQGGRNFSGGQRQRLTIARALIRKPDILILDDSSSALDYATDAALRRALRELEGAPTVFIVAQRATALRHADTILVLDDGALVGMGTHDELLTSCDTYREIVESQYRKESV